MFGTDTMPNKDQHFLQCREIIFAAFFSVIFNIFHFIYSSSAYSLWHNQLLEWLQLKSGQLHVLTDHERLGFF